MKYDFSRAKAQITGRSLKGAILPTGTVITIDTFREGSFKDNQGNDVPNDQLLCKADGANLNVPVREFLKMKIEGEGAHYEHEGDAATCEFPDKIEVISSAGRVDTAGNPIFPIMAYNDAEAQLKSGNIDWNALVASGLRDNHGLPQVQDYTIKVL